MARPRKKVKGEPDDRLIPGHRCTLCGQRGFPSDFGKNKQGYWNSHCKECINRMHAYRKEAEREGRVLAPMENRPWWKPTPHHEVEQRLCWEYIDKDISEEEWDRLCDRLAGSVNPGGGTAKRGKDK